MASLSFTCILIALQVCVQLYLVREGQGGERRNTFGPFDAHEEETRCRLAHGLRRHFIEVHGSAADLVRILKGANKHEKLKK